MWTKSTLTTVTTILSSACGVLLVKIRRDSLVEALLEEMKEKDRRWSELTRDLLALPQSTVPIQMSSPEPENSKSPERDVPLGSLPFDAEILREMQESSRQVMSSSTKEYPGVPQFLPGNVTMNLSGSEDT